MFTYVHEYNNVLIILQNIMTLKIPNEIAYKYITTLFLLTNSPDSLQIPVY